MWTSGKRTETISLVNMLYYVHLKIIASSYISINFVVFEYTILPLIERLCFFQNIHVY